MEQLKLIIVMRDQEQNGRIQSLPLKWDPDGKKPKQIQVRDWYLILSCDSYEIFWCASAPVRDWSSTAPVRYGKRWFIYILNCARGPPVWKHVSPMPAMRLRLWATISNLTAILRHQSIEVWIAIGSLRQLTRGTRPRLPKRDSWKTNQASASAREREKLRRVPPRRPVRQSEMSAQLRRRQLEFSAQLRQCRRYLERK